MHQMVKTEYLKVSCFHLSLNYHKTSFFKNTTFHCTDPILQFTALFMYYQALCMHMSAISKPIPCQMWGGLIKALKATCITPFYSPLIIRFAPGVCTLLHRPGRPWRGAVRPCSLNPCLTWDCWVSLGRHRCDLSQWSPTVYITPS